MLAAAGARVIDRELPIALADEAFDEHGMLTVPEQMLELDGILAELLAEGARHARDERVALAASGRIS